MFVWSLAPSPPSHSAAKPTRFLYTAPPHPTLRNISHRGRAPLPSPADARRVCVRVCACARACVLKSTLSRFSQAGHQERHLTRLLPPHGWREHDGMGHMTQAAIGQAQCRSLSLHSRALHKPPYFQENVLRAAGRQARLGAPRRSFAFTCILIANDHFNLKPSNFI